MSVRIVQCRLVAQCETKLRIHEENYGTQTALTGLGKKPVEKARATHDWEKLNTNDTLGETADNNGDK